MVLLYKFLTNLFYPIIILIIFSRKFLKKEDSNRYREKIFSSNFNSIKKKNKLIWFHAASIGELKSILPIIYHLNQSRPNLEFLITTVTLSSGNLAKKEIERFDNVYHRFFPIDVNFLIDKFLKEWDPDIVFLVDSEIWPNLILNINKKKIPLAIINARITKKTFRKWMLIPKTAKLIFSSFDLCLTSNIETKKFLSQLNAKNIFYEGNIKLINYAFSDYKNSFKSDGLGKNKLWLAASTHSGEELFCIETHIKLRKKLNDVVTIIAPRHINRVSEIKELCNKKKINSKIINHDEEISNDYEVYIINYFGALSKYYKFAKSVFIGKSLIKKLKDDSGQNPIDAAKSGCKIYHGPYVYNFEEIYQILKENGVSKIINTVDDLVDYLYLDLNNSNVHNNKISSKLNNLGEQTLFATMKNINKFLLNEFN